LLWNEFGNKQSSAALPRHGYAPAAALDDLGLDPHSGWLVFFVDQFNCFDSDLLESVTGIDFQAIASLDFLDRRRDVIEILHG
jgi:hypothetical protein